MADLITIPAKHFAEILVVDDSPENLLVLVEILKKNNYRSKPVKSGALALKIARSSPPDLVLLDINMPEMDGYAVCRELKRDSRLSYIPVIFISSNDQPEEKVEAFAAGGVDYITKPFQPEEVLARIAIHLKINRLQIELERHNVELQSLVEERMKEISDSQMATISALAKLAECRDDDTGRHIERVQTFSKLLAVKMKDNPARSGVIDDKFIMLIEQASALHDIGKVGISDSILQKPGELTDEEMQKMRTHPLIGVKTLSSVAERYPKNLFLKMGIEIARSHHEKWNGSGYPDGLAGEQIPISARIVALADFYDAIRSDRCYRRGLPHEIVCAMIIEQKERHFDPEIVDEFVRNNDQFAEAYEKLRYHDIKQ